MTPEQPVVPPPAPLSASDERTYAMLAHLGILVNLATAYLGVAVPLVIYFVYKDRSRYVAYQSLQALVFQLVWWVGGTVLFGIGFAISTLLSMVFIGILCLPFVCLFLLMPLAALGYGVYAGVETSQGRDFKYWVIGDWVRGTLAN